MNHSTRQRSILLEITVCALAFSLFTVFFQARFMGFDRLQEGGFQVDNHQQMMDGHRGNPFQYRILSEWGVELFLRVVKQTGLPFPSAIAFMGFRLLQNIFIFIFAAYYYKKLRLNTFTAFLGMAFLAYSFTQALYAADLQFNTYSDVLFYLLAGLAILHKRENWIIPITFLAALNRETSGLIPFLLLAANVSFTPTLNVPRRILIISGISVALYSIVFIGLRIAYAPQELMIPYGNHIGIELLVYNLTLPATYIEVFGVLSILPILAIIARKNWSLPLQRFFWTLVPLWFLIHIFASIIAESRLLLVPQALIFIPGALLGVQAATRSTVTAQQV